jgi:hypothetical protein
VPFPAERQDTLSEARLEKATITSSSERPPWRLCATRLIARRSTSSTHGEWELVITTRQATRWLNDSCISAHAYCHRKLPNTTLRSTMNRSPSGVRVSSGSILNGSNGEQRATVATKTVDKLRAARAGHRRLAARLRRKRVRPLHIRSLDL